MEADKVTWDDETHAKFEKILEEIPHMIRGIAEVRVRKKAQNIVAEDNRAVIAEKDMVDAFFAETPEGFMPPMKESMQELGINYEQYGHK